MKINGIEIAGYESIVANLDVVNDEIRPLNHKENFSCNDRIKVVYGISFTLITYL